MKHYLGDAVYVDFDGYMLVLTTEDGIRATNTIALEPEVYRALLQYVAILTARAETVCDECGHKVSLHNDRYGCQFERGDEWVTGNQPEAPTVLMAQGPCGCTAWTIEKISALFRGEEQANG